MPPLIRLAWLAPLFMLLAGCSAFDLSPGPSVPPPPPKPGKPNPIKAITPRALQGLTPDQVVAMLGRPASESRKALGLVWQYRSGNCALSLAFFPEVETMVERVLNVEFQGTDSEAACLARLTEQRGRHGP